MTEPGTAIPEEAARAALAAYYAPVAALWLVEDFAAMKRALAAALPHLGPVVHADTDEVEQLRAMVRDRDEALEQARIDDSEATG